MYILGIDPALGNLGWGLIDKKSQKLSYVDSGIIKTTTSQSIPLRLAAISMQLENIILKYQPAKVAMEETYINSNALSSLKLAFVRGAVMALVGKYNIHFSEYKPNSIKKIVVGNGHADKAQVLHMVKLLISGSNNVVNLDIADALAIAYTCSVHDQIEPKLSINSGKKLSINSGKNING